MIIRDEDYLRKRLYDGLVAEIVGPDPNNPYKDETTGEELLLDKVHGAPYSKYGAGILYPQKVRVQDSSENDSGDENGIEPMVSNEESQEPNQKNTHGAATLKGSDDDPSNDPIDLANQYQQSAMGFTFRVDANKSNLKVKISINAAAYEKSSSKIQQKIIKDGEIAPLFYTKKENDDETQIPLLRDYWIRKSLEISPLIIDLKTIDENEKYELIKDNSENNWLNLIIVNRTPVRDKEKNILTFTVTIINQKEASQNDRPWYLYQCSVNLTPENNIIYPYQERRKKTDTDEEDMMALLYRNKPVYAIGHGCAALWDMKDEMVTTIETSNIPLYEMAQIAPTTFVELSMYNLSDLGDWKEGLASMQALLTKYKSWIDDARLKSEKLDIKYRSAAKNNLKLIANNYNRIKDGVEFLSNEENANAIKCFRWMNRAMLWQQQRSKTDQRKWIRKGKSKEFWFDLESISKFNNEDGNFLTLNEYDELSLPNKPIGRWRPFQLAFVLMNIKSTWDGNHEDREVVDLIWFPTGGGKTEAYLGLSAFQIFSRRIQGNGPIKADVLGTSILMRYTLRLLTIQQYERAASLICACELIRKKNKLSLGSKSISIGLWVGGANTPNKNVDAIRQFNKLSKENDAEYNFIVMKCPCCGAQIGKVDKPTNSVKVKGIYRTDGAAASATTYFQCKNTDCEFVDEKLPLYVVDEDIYNHSPTLVLGTVDKFAMIPWNKDAAKIFGFREGNNGWSRIKPPELIIQDELHLISGPLGSMVGLYETMVQTLCNNYILNKPPFLPDCEDLNEFIPPKIVASSATISRSAEQVKALYGSDKLNIFPPQGLSFGETWFSEEKEISKENPGRLYIGLCAFPNQSAQTAIARAYSSILQKVSLLDDKEGIDYYWTLLGFFNSIRELGGASSLIHGDIKDRMSQIYNRDIITKPRRWIKDEELTSRIANQEIPRILNRLSDAKNIDVCLATNMVATGVDISRLGLMFIHGQPKTTSEYIQASSRVGRDVPKGPGFVVTMYSPSKPRDKSIFEHFQGYHSRIYANVEPSSVTPFTINVRERALHAVVIALTRHLSNGTMRNNDAANIDESDFQVLQEKIKVIISNRAGFIDENELEQTQIMYNKFIKEWMDFNPQYYGDAGNYGILNHERTPLMYALGNEVLLRILNSNSRPTPTSMRGVDTESNIELI